MDESDRYPEFAHETGDPDEVEILEVVGIEGEGESPIAPTAPPAVGEIDEAEGEEEEEEEYLLDFDDLDRGMLADRCETAGAAAPPAAVPDAGGGSDRLRLLRVRADYDNLRKRIEREREEFELHANFGLVGRLLPVVDNLERALAADSGTEGLLREGLIMIHRQLTDQLRQEGLTPIEAVGQPFDPSLHDAVATDDDSEAPANTIVEEFQRGYLFQDRVLRPSLVKVSTGPLDPAEES